MSRTLYRGTVEYLTGTVTADLEITDSDAIAVSFDRETWHAAAWVGPTGTTRSWRILIDDAVPLPAWQAVTTYVRITDNPETPVLLAGVLKIV